MQKLVVDGDGGLGEVGAEAFSDAVGFVEVSFGEDDGEFFAAVATDEVAGAKGGAAVFGQDAEYLVSGGVAVDVVDLFEVVDIHHDGGECGARVEGPFKFAVGEFKEVAAVVETGERVGDG